MLLKKTIQYREKGLIFPRTKLPEPIEVGRALLVCKICSFYNDRGACSLKYREEINVEGLKCGFDYFYSSKKDKWTKSKSSYAYVAQEKSDM
jgi:hypothetical protein